MLGVECERTLLVFSVVAKGACDVVYFFCICFSVLRFDLPVLSVSPSVRLFLLFLVLSVFSHLVLPVPPFVRLFLLPFLSVYSSFWFTCSFCLLLFVCFSYSLYSSSSFVCSSCASFYHSLLSVPLFIVCSRNLCSVSLYSFCSCLCLFLSPGLSVSFHSSVLSVSSSRPFIPASFHSLFFLSLFLCLLLSIYSFCLSFHPSVLSVQPYISLFLSVSPPVRLFFLLVGCYLYSPILSICSFCSSFYPFDFSVSYSSVLSVSFYSIPLSLLSLLFLLFFFLFLSLSSPFYAYVLSVLLFISIFSQCHSCVCSCISSILPVLLILLTSPSAPSSTLLLILSLSLPSISCPSSSPLLLFASPSLSFFL
ncbi:uncharacterized protein, partial [Penaeus vannamei]|uniref:uncharacterized protein n=1 Tax=Penaeus vannamei TaxID=6689 RepID=UPI00387F5567